MFICEVSGMTAERGVRPVRVVLSRYGPTDFTTRTVHSRNPYSGARTVEVIRIPLDGQIKKEVKVLPEVAKTLTPCPHVRSIHFSEVKKHRNESLLDQKKPRTPFKKQRTRRDDESDEF